MSLKRLSDAEQKHYIKYCEKHVVDERLQEGLDYTQQLVDTNANVDPNKNVKKFFSPHKFEYFEMTEEEMKVKENKLNKITYCKTCDVLRPPRTFHCNKCQMCVEVHDHHCVWVGTCIGKRNIKQFT